MNILGIESSCDETSAALVQNGRKILSNVVYSQNPMHEAFRGIVPEIASRAHVEKINWVIEEALKLGARSKELGVRLKNSSPLAPRSSPAIDGIAVTVGPGLVGSLLVGKMAAQALSWIWRKPVVGINHLEAHLFANALEHAGLKPPFLGLIVSGGHTDLVIVEDYGRYKVIGRTRDDAAGESYDKVANLLNLGYPGGPSVDRLAQKGNPKAIPFPHPHLPGTWDFSFSGLKTAVLYYLDGSRFAVRGSRGKKVSVSDICASFQNSVASVLVKKTILAAKSFHLKKISVGGGVAANSEIRKRFIFESKKNDLKIYLPCKELCTDNAAMVAALGYYKLSKVSPRTANRKPRTDLDIDPSLPIRNWE